MKRTKSLPVFPIALVAVFASHLVQAEDWPQWRGPKRDDVSTETGLLKEWPAGGPPLAWKASGLGKGYSSVAVAKGQVITMGDVGDASFVIARREADGAPLWTTPVGKPGGNVPGTRCTPTVDGDCVYALGQFGDLVCLEAATGAEVWRTSLVTDLGGKYSGWNYAESPLVDGDRVLCTPGGARGALAALHKRTGAVVWRTTDFTDGAQYSSPIAIDLGGRRQYVQLTGQSVVGVDAGTGKVLWRAARNGRTATIPTPVFRDGYVYVTSGYGVGCNLFRVTSRDGAFVAEEVYANTVMVNHHGGVVLWDGHIYGYSDSKGWVCQNFASGEAVWSNRNLDKGSITYADSRLYLRAESGRGTVALIEATPAGYVEHGRFDQPDRSKERSWPHPVVAHGRLYLRDQDILLCYDVKAR